MADAAYRRERALIHEGMLGASGTGLAGRGEAGRKASCVVARVKSWSERSKTTQLEIYDKRTMRDCEDLGFAIPAGTGVQEGSVSGRTAGRVAHGGHGDCASVSVYLRTALVGQCGSYLRPGRGSWRSHGSAAGRFTDRVKGGVYTTRP